MTPEAHALHHATLRRDFATNTGWSNPLVNLIFRAAMSRGWIDERGLEPTLTGHGQAANSSSCCGLGATARGGRRDRAAASGANRRRR